MSETKLLVRVPPSSRQCYPIVFGRNHWGATLSRFLSCKSYTKVSLLVDQNVFTHWKDALLNGCTGGEVIIVPSGEHNKSIATAMDVVKQLMEKGFDRKGLLVAVGGGVVGDLCGFVASVYMRGVDFVQIPTTVLAIVDSSIGGKTGVDTAHGKNLVGSFYFPQMVISDTVFLSTLPYEHKQNGFAEMVKHALIADGQYYKTLRCHVSHSDMWTEILWRSCRIKASVVQRDPKEKNLRQILNFGHTLGHAIEHASNYQLLHGFAVAWGMLGEAYIAYRKGFFREEELSSLRGDFHQMEFLLQATHILSLQWEDVSRALLCDKKNLAGQVRMVLLDRIGRVRKDKKNYAHPVDQGLLRDSFRFLQKTAGEVRGGY